MPNTHPIARVITNTRARQIIYGVFVLALVVVGAIQVGYGALEAPVPAAVTVALEVLTYLGIPVGALALANAPTVGEVGERDYDLR